MLDYLHIFKCRYRIVMMGQQPLSKTNTNTIVVGSVPNIYPILLRQVAYNQAICYKVSWSKHEIQWVI